MKNKIKIFMASSMALLATGCTDLDVNTESMYQQHPNPSLNSLYITMRDCYGRRYMEANAFSSDEFSAVSFGNNWYDSGVYARASLHNYMPDDATIDWYATVSSGIVKANEIIANPDFAEMHPYARVMRAFFTFILMEHWGDTPILDPVANTGNYIERKPRAEVARYIESELLDVIPQLTEEVSENTYGTATKWMAEALLAKVYINWAVYTSKNVEDYDAATAKNEKLDACIAICDSIIKSGKFNLGSMPYMKKFSYDNGPHVEDFIYAIPYDNILAQGMQYGRSHVYKDIKKLNPNYYGITVSNSGGGYAVVTPECVNRFCLEGDERNYSIVGGTVYNYDPETLTPTTEVCLDSKGNPLVFTKEIKLVQDNDQTLNVGDDIEGYRQGYHSVKWFIQASDYNNGRNQSNDLPIFRYADILLMKAEALVRSGKASDAKPLFNEIRAYAKAPLLETDPTLDDLYDERGREFFDENWRRNDMIRFGHFEDEFFPHKKSFSAARFDKTCRIFPISTSMLNIHKNDWKQNNGY